MVNVKNSLVNRTSSINRVGPYSWEQYLSRVKSFHSYPAPGVIIGGVMVSIAMEQIPKGVLFDVICETSSCLPDAVQILTPCTVGNGWLKIINLGLYAVSLYDKHSGSGVRIYPDLNKLQGWDEIQAWLLKLRTKREQDTELLQEQIWRAGRDIYTLHPVQIKPQYLTKYSKGPIGICSVCGEAYPVKERTICLGCQGESPWEIPTSSTSTT